MNTSPEVLLEACPKEIDRELVIITAPRLIFEKRILEALQVARTIEELVSSLNPLNQSIFLTFYMEAHTAKYGESQN